MLNANEPSNVTIPSYILDRLFASEITLDLDEEVQSTGLNLLSTSCMVKNQQKKTDLKNSGVKIISIGEDCFSRTVPTRWKLKPRKHEGEKTYPFDLAVHPIDATLEIIQNGFSGYTDPAHLRLTSKNIAVHRIYNCTFNHETNPAFFENRFDLLIRTINRRVQNFITLDAQTPHLLFIFHTKWKSNATSGKINMLLDLLVKLYQDNAVHLYVVDSYAQIYLQELSEAVGYFGLTYPSSNYIWHGKRYYSGFEGILYEMLFMQRLVQFVDDHVLT